MWIFSIFTRLIVTTSVSHFRSPSSYPIDLFMIALSSYMFILEKVVVFVEKTMLFILFLTYIIIIFVSFIFYKRG